MKYKLSLYQKMVQKMALTPQMRQSIQLLSMPTKELNEYIDSVIEKNPFLKKESEFVPGSRPPYEFREPGTRKKLAPSVDYAESQAVQKDNPRLSLVSQARMLDLDDKIFSIVEYLIYEIDSNGYINVDIDTVAEDLFVKAEDVEEALSVIQSMEPAGIGARDVRECLMLQIERLNKKDSLEYMIARDYINELAKNDVKKISKDMDKDESAILKAIRNIKKMNPRPASSILSDKEESIAPDMVAFIKLNKVRLQLNRDWIPRLKLYNPYENKLDIVKDNDAREFLKKNMNDAKQLIDSIKRREETMCKVTDYILNYQKDYIKENVSNIKSLTINDVAEALSLHPSTISRTISNKFIQINDKVVPLKALLSHSIKNGNNGLTSKSQVKEKIKHIIDNENKSKPHNDAAIMNRLTEEGILIKRRTVAKYREALRILPSHLRRKKS